MTTTTTKTGWFIRKAKPTHHLYGVTGLANVYYPVYVFADGDERGLGDNGLCSVDHCREIIRDHFDGGKKAPKRYTRGGATEAPDGHSVRLQGVGYLEAIPAGEVAPGMTITFNYGITAEVVRVSSVSARFVEIHTKDDEGKVVAARYHKDRPIAAE